MYLLPKLTFVKAVICWCVLPVLAMYLVSGAGRAAQLPTCLFGILLAKFGLWAESLPQRGLEPLSSHSEDQFQYLNLSGGVLRRVWLITFARGKVTNIWWYPTRVKRPSRIAWAHPFCNLERLDIWNRISSLWDTSGFGGGVLPCAGGIMGNLGHLPWPLWETYGFHLDGLAALEGTCMATFSVPWAAAQRGLRWWNFNTPLFLSFLWVQMNRKANHRHTSDMYERHVLVTYEHYDTVRAIWPFTIRVSITVQYINNIYMCVEFRVAYHETSHILSCPYDTSFCLFPALVSCRGRFRAN